MSEKEFAKILSVVYLCIITFRMHGRYAATEKELNMGLQMILRTF